ncbi:MAG TPA: flagellar motor protein MotB [Thermotogota bacterium]|nr:flagellar motor protein MotB [Thermotogota bacterium]HPJ89787.1 flagellar motor protein MotB [Thermotogota bacterium]HPR95731.1 flagellar motor protein MotB [Thermotogota bacterium]
MAKKQKKTECPAGAPAWMSTYGDMVTLLLTFFIAMLAFSSISEGKFQEVASGITRIFSGNPPSVLMGGKTTVSEPIVTTNPGIKEDLLKIIQDEGVQGKITVENTDQGTVITLGDMVYFEPFSAILTKEAKELLEKIGSVIVEHTTNVIEMYGYTDDRKLPEGSIYPSLLHLSSARASSVAEFFINDLKNKRMAERVVDIRNGKFDIEKYYNPARFVPVGKGDNDALTDINKLDLKYKAEIELLDFRVKDGEITEEGKTVALKELQSMYGEELTTLRNGYQKITILIKRENVR